MVLLEVDELLLQGFNFALQVHAAQVGVVDDLPQTDDVGLHRLADGQLRLVSEQDGAEWVRINLARLLVFTESVSTLVYSSELALSDYSCSIGLYNSCMFSLS